MRKIRDNILRIATAVDMFVSAILLMIYSFTGITLLMTFYYLGNTLLLVLVIIYSLDLVSKRDKIERTKRHIDKLEDKDR